MPRVVKSFRGGGKLHTPDQPFKRAGLTDLQMIQMYANGYLEDVTVADLLDPEDYTDLLDDYQQFKQIECAGCRQPIN